MRIIAYYKEAECVEPRTGLLVELSMRESNALLFTLPLVTRSLP
jgi:hypothetical protein